MKGFKGRLGLKPFERTGIEATTEKHFAQVKQKVTLTGLLVVFGNENVPTGATVYVMPDGIKTWGKNTYDVEGKQIIICEETNVLFVKMPAGQ